MIINNKDIHLTKEQKDYCKSLKKGYLVRDASGNLYHYKNKPIRSSLIKGIWAITGIDTANPIYLDEKIPDFPFIKWEDDEPYDIEELLGNRKENIIEYIKSHLFAIPEDDNNVFLKFSKEDCELIINSLEATKELENEIKNILEERINELKQTLSNLQQELYINEQIDKQIEVAHMTSTNQLQLQNMLNTGIVPNFNYYDYLNNK